MALYDFVGHLIFLIVTRILNSTTRGKTLLGSVHMETDITALLDIEACEQHCGEIAVLELHYVVQPSSTSHTS